MKGRLWRWTSLFVPLLIACWYAGLRLENFLEIFLPLLSLPKVVAADWSCCGRERGNRVFFMRYQRELCVFVFCWDLNNINTEGADREGVRAAVLFTGRSQGDVGMIVSQKGYLDGGF
jgi:hypothetical protein